MDVCAPGPFHAVFCNTFKWDILLCVHIHSKSLKCKLCVSLHCEIPVGLGEFKEYNSSSSNRFIVLLLCVRECVVQCTSKKYYYRQPKPSLSNHTPILLFTSSQFTLLDLSIYIGKVNTCSAKWVALGHPSSLPWFPCFMSLNHHIISCFCVFFAIICACRNVCIWEWSTAILYY